MTDDVLPVTMYAHVMGRHVVEEDGNVRFDWPGVRLTFAGIQGTTTIAIRMKGGGSVFGYQVTPGSSKQQILNCFWNRISQKTYVLAKGLDPKQTYQVEIWKRDDPGNGVVEVSGLVLDEGGTATKATEKDKKKMIEFVGDSDTVGFGNTAARSGMLFSLMFELPCMYCGVPSYVKATDASQSWPAYLSRSLNVDYSIVAESGIGAKYSEGVDHNMIDIYRRPINRDGKSKSVPLSPVDAVVVYIGMNDLSNLKGSFSASDERLLKGFRQLLTLIRQLRPDVKIVVVAPHEDAVLACVTTKRECANTAKVQNRVWKQAVEELGGEDSGFYVVENRHEPQIKLNSREDHGMMLHWNASSSKKWADGLIENLRKLLDIGEGK